MYILDTSAIRGISSEKLRLAATKVKIAVSTLTVLELASHLNDSSDETSYLRARGNLIKCQIPILLDDPFWLLSQKLQSSSNPTRRDDKVVLSQLIAAAEQSQSLEELGAKSLAFPDGSVVSCLNIGERIGEILKDEEDSFVSHIQSLPALAHLDPALNGKHRLISVTLFGQLTAATQSLSPMKDWNLQAKTFLATAPYFGYLTHRLYHYANCRSPGETMLPIDRNDCEDAYISLNLDLYKGDTLVTNDKGTLAALRNTLTLLNEILPTPLTSSYVMTNDEFLIAVEP
ncbi:hypothetical protein ACOI8A_23925 [Pseudomonas sp. P4795]|uniref:hypothetical protein n=1 Tax=Pseudomonas sp. P4795 TaxID=3409915 RepID=UPI003B5CD175